VGTRSSVSRFDMRGLGDSQNTSIMSKHKRGCWDGISEPPILLFNAREGWRVVETPLLCRNMRGCWDGVPEPPHLAFQHEGGLESG